MGHELDGVQSKIDRALEHIKSLQDKSASFLEGQPYDIAQKPQADGWERAIFHVQREPPLELGVIAGDFAHNLRSGLDHLIYQLAVLDTGGDPPNRTGFPIFEDEGRTGSRVATTARAIAISCWLASTKPIGHLSTRNSRMQTGC